RLIFGGRSSFASVVAKRSRADGCTIGRQPEQPDLDERLAAQSNHRPAPRSLPLSRLHQAAWSRPPLYSQSARRVLCGGAAVVSIPLRLFPRALVPIIRGRR